MARHVLWVIVCYSSILLAYPIPVRAEEPIRISYSSVNPHALLVSLAEKRGLYATLFTEQTRGLVPQSAMAKARDARREKSARNTGFTPRLKVVSGGTR